MQSKQALVPKLRFSDYDEEWFIHPMGKIFSNSKLKGEEGLPTLSVTINRGLVLRDSNERKTETNLSASQHRLVKKGEIAYNTMRMWQGAYGRASFDGIVSPAYVIISQNNKLRSDFSEYFLKLSRTRYLFWAYSYGLTNDRLRLYYDDFAKIKVSLPSLPEQEKIAAFLTSVDDRIDQLKRKKSLLQDYKKGAMQKLFSQELRFKDEHGNDYPDWEEKKLGELCKITTGKLDANAMKPDGDYRFYTCAKEHYMIDVFAFDTEALLISGNGANVGYIHYYKGKFNAYQRTYVLDGFSQNITFIQYVLQSSLKDRIDREKKAGNTPYIVMGTLTDMKIALPSLPEQIKIANLLSSLDQKIEQVDTQITQTQTFKKGLLQQMFV